MCGKCHVPFSPHVGILFYIEVRLRYATGDN